VEIDDLQAKVQDLDSQVKDREMDAEAIIQNGWRIWSRGTPGWSGERRGISDFRF